MCYVHCSVYCVLFPVYCYLVYCVLYLVIVLLIPVCRGAVRKGLVAGHLHTTELLFSVNWLLVGLSLYVAMSNVHMSVCLFNTCPPNSSENTGEGLTGKSYLLSPQLVTNAVTTLKLPSQTDLTQGVLEAGHFFINTLLLGGQCVIHMDVFRFNFRCTQACVQ